MDRASARRLRASSVEYVHHENNESCGDEVRGKKEREKKITVACMGDETTSLKKPQNMNKKKKTAKKKGLLVT